jgi:lysophospholipase L1-like esterase
MGSVDSDLAETRLANKKMVFTVYRWFELTLSFMSNSMPRFALGFVMMMAVAASLAVAAEKESPSLKKGDRIVFFGDSITAQGASPTGYVTLIKKGLAAKHKDLEIEVVGAGVSGNRVPNLQQRLEKDVLAKKPTLVVIYIGINDVWHWEKNPPRGTPKEKFEAGLKEMIGKIQKAGAGVVLCTPSVIGEKKAGANKLDAMLDEYSEISRKVAAESGARMCDLRKAFVAYLSQNNPEDKEKGILTGDRVHLNGAGNNLVAVSVLAVIDK